MSASEAKDPVLELEKDVSETLDEFFHVLVATGRASDFVSAMKGRAEIAVRMLPRLPVENRGMATGQISICYELADRAKAALAASSPLATEDEANRIRKEVAAMK